MVVSKANSIQMDPDVLLKFQQVQLCFLLLWWSWWLWWLWWLWWYQLWCLSWYGKIVERWNRNILKGWVCSLSCFLIESCIYWILLVAHMASTYAGLYKTWTLDCRLDSRLNNGLDSWTKTLIARGQRSHANYSIPCFAVPWCPQLEVLIICTLQGQTLVANSAAYNDDHAWIQLCCWLIFTLLAIKFLG